MSDLEEKLIASLEIVRSEFDKGVDDWRFQLLRTIKRYLHENGVSPSLIAPIQKMELEIADEILKARRRAVGERGSNLPINRSITMAFAAAAVTVLKKRSEFESIEAATAKIARLTGHKKSELKNFRDNVNRALLSQEILDAYAHDVAWIHDWSKAEIFAVLSGMADFVK